jgi:hypothetical protein
MFFVIGAGKTTISRLFFRFYDVLGGAVKVNGKDVRMVTQKSLRGSIGVVPQSAVMFNDTIRENLRYGRRDATQEELDQAARDAQLLEFIESLDDGWDTVVGDRGLKLSGGEKQRAAIARCLLKDPPFVLLDEATSALGMFEPQFRNSSCSMPPADAFTHTFSLFTLCRYYHREKRPRSLGSSRFPPDCSGHCPSLGHSTECRQYYCPERRCRSGARHTRRVARKEGNLRVVSRGYDSENFLFLVSRFALFKRNRCLDVLLLVFFVLGCGKCNFIPLAMLEAMIICHWNQWIRKRKRISRF